MPRPSSGRERIPRKTRVWEFSARAGHISAFGLGCLTCKIIIIISMEMIEGGKSV